MSPKKSENGRIITRSHEISVLTSAFVETQNLALEDKQGSLPKVYADHWRHSAVSGWTTAREPYIMMCFQIKKNYVAYTPSRALKAQVPRLSSDRTLHTN